MVARPRISILLPLQDEREAGLESIRAWSTGQTAPASSFEIIAVALGEDRRLERAVRPLLRADDRWIELPGADEYEAFNAGAREARGPFLFLTEVHCVPERDCLATMLEELERTGASGVRGTSTAESDGPFGALELEAVKRAQLAEEDPRHWRKVLIHSFAIRRDLYLDVGGLRSERYGDFSPWVLSMTLDERGERPAFSPRPRVRHSYDGDFRKMRAFVRSFMQGEVRYRSDHPSPSTERYLGWAGEWEGRLEHTRTGALRALRAGLLLRRRGMVKLLFGHAAVAALGRGASIARASAGAELAAFQARLARDPERRRRRFQEFWVRTSRRGRLQGLAKTEHSAEPLALRDPIDLTGFLGGSVIGFHQPEAEESDAPFRWTAPLAMLRVNVRGDGRMCARLELRHSEWAKDVSIRVAVDNRVVPATVSTDAIEFEVESGVRWIALGSKPIRPGRRGGDRRVLGLPVRSLSFRPAGPQPPRMRAVDE